MNSQEEICTKQNNPEMLDCQYAARVLFNTAEKCGYFALFFGIVSSLFIFLNEEPLSLLLPLIVDILILFFTCLRNKFQKQASNIRMYFDSFVLGIKEEDFSEADIRSIRDTAECISLKDSLKHDQQIQNTGRDNPPGVKDWYEFSGEFSGYDAVFECQKQNYWWNKQLCRNRLILSAIAFCLYVLTFITICWLNRISCFKSLICIIGMILSLFEQVCANFNYIKLSNTMEDYIKLPGIAKNVDQLECLQNKINSRRELPVLEMNWLYKRNNKLWSERYEKISRK